RHPEPVRVGGDHLQRLGADGARTAQHDDVSHGASLSCPPGERNGGPVRSRNPRAGPASSRGRRPMPHENLWKRRLAPSKLRRNARSEAISAAPHLGRVSGVSQPLLRASAAEHGLRPRAVLDFLDDLDQELHSLMIVRRGVVLVEGWWAPYRPDQVQLLYSVSKSFTSTAVGLAVAEGRLDLDSPLLDHLDGLGIDPAGPRIRSLTVADALRMATGHAEDVLWQSFVADPHEPLCGFFGIEPEHEPG